MLVDIQKEFFTLNEYPRLGMILLSISEEDHPLGSLLVNPEQEYIINECREFVKRLNAERQKFEKERVRRNVGESRSYES